MIQVLHRRASYARVLYALVLTGMISPSYALDFVGICYVCSLDRGQHSSLKKLILNPAIKARIVEKQSHCLISAGSIFRGPPPLVKKEYRKDELERIKRMKKRPEPDELAVMFEDVNRTQKSWMTMIPEGWTKYAVGRARVRDCFRIDGKIDQIVAELQIMSDPFLTDTVNWARPQIQDIRQKLQYLMTCYDLQEHPKEDGKPDAVDHESLFTGFALTAIRQ